MTGRRAPTRRAALRALGALCAAGGAVAASACGPLRDRRAPAAQGGRPAGAPSPLAIPALRARAYDGGRVEVVRRLDGGDGYERRLIAYDSDGLRVTGVMTLPAAAAPGAGAGASGGNGPFPVLLLNHGDIPREQYRSGEGTAEAAGFLTRAGYLTLASDYRGYAGSEDGVADPLLLHHRPEFAVDVLNLLAAVATVPEADPQRTGIWGHSLGGETALRVLAADREARIKAAVLWAPSSADVNANNAFYTPKETPPLPAALNRQLSPLYHAHLVGAPVSLHQGDADREVKPEWAAQIRDALQQAGKTVELHAYPGEGHDLRGAADVVARTVEFFDRYLKEGG